ncbi:DUF1707 domain-containing protein [Nocardioides sp. CER19]|uniref:DUF1707 domain-containing protein n=1 Tax=Nocardioides sp. CER19 TaxID=3038538 RepID=UPI00244A626E|nr:DUF1707 domain-containing protein [Nocardioides sp. CER19]MDH2416527.1 DUF1707 domain-containing protein [Nocardioides sp. CER19]
MEDFWERFRLDPRVPGNAGMRASDADRELVRTLLADAYADGRLTRDEYDERLTAVLSAVTLADLPPVVADLVPSTPVSSPARLSHGDIRARAEESWRKKLRDDVGAVAFISVILWTIWLFTSHGFPWPIFPMLAVGINAVNTVLHRDEIVAKETARLERKRARELRRPDRPEDDA